MNLRYIAAAPLLWAFASSCSGSAEASLFGFLSCSDFTDMSVAPVPEIRMLVLYSEEARDAATDKGIEAEIEHAVLEANAVMSWSNIPLRVALAHMELLPGLIDGGAETMRLALVAGTGVYAKAHALRDTWHADVVALVTTSGGGNAEPMLQPGMGASTKAFLVAGRVEMGVQFTLTHELGHLLGGVHTRTPLDPADLPSYPYAFPKVAAGGGWRTMMATPGATRIEHFSNPDVLYFVNPDDPYEIGEPTGTAITDALPADNRRTLTNTGPIVSAFRFTPAWFASSGAATPWFEKRVGDELMTDVRFADLNGDGVTDAFKIASDGAWLVSYGATEPWKTFRAADPLGAPLSKLRFADFVGDAADDVFYVDGAANKWVVYQSGAADWVDLNTDPSIAGIGVEDLDFGEFSGAATKADVFRSDAATGTWYVSRDGTTAWEVLPGPAAGVKLATKQLRLGDFDGDGITDVFRSQISPTKAWYWSQSGTANWTALLTDDAAGYPVDDLLLGDFDGDGVTDVLRPDGAMWYLSLKGQAVPVLHRISCIKPGNMALGDFDGDGSTDVIRAGIRP